MRLRDDDSQPEKAEEGRRKGRGRDFTYGIIMADKELKAKAF